MSVVSLHVQHQRDRIVSRPLESRSVEVVLLRDDVFFFVAP